MLHPSVTQKWVNEEGRKRDHGSMVLELEGRVTSSPPPFRLKCTTPLSVPRLVNFQSARAMEREEPTSSRLVVVAVVLLLIAPPRGVIIVASRSRCNSVAPVPPCLNSAFHDKDSDIVTWYNPGARTKRPAPGLGRAPRRRLFEARRLEIKRGARASPCHA
ncbi:hypothetical protein GW17_00048468 [Ensete ventricosum]|nr:hypothetical protein GW17_00048468 [Ensete ventricosum]